MIRYAKLAEEVRLQWAGADPVPPRRLMPASDGCQEPAGLKSAGVILCRLKRRCRAAASTAGSAPS